MAKIYLALGSNVGDAKKNIESAVRLLSEKISNIAQASFYSSKPMYYADQPDFVNTAISGDTALSPHELLAFAKDVEKKIGRIERFKNGPREIDIDIVLYDDIVLDTPELTIPHPLMNERPFVLEPLAELQKNEN